MMINLLLDHIGEVSSLIVVVGVIISMISWQTKQLKNELERIRLNADRANERIDNMYTVMISFLQNERKQK
jgi:hypothetical protein